MKSLFFIEISVTTYQETRRHIPEYLDIRQYRWENLTSHRLILFNLPSEIPNYQNNK